MPLTRFGTSLPSSIARAATHSGSVPAANSSHCASSFAARVCTAMHGWFAPDATVLGASSRECTGPVDVNASACDLECKRNGAQWQNSELHNFSGHCRDIWRSATHDFQRTAMQLLSHHVSARLQSYDQNPTKTKVSEGSIPAERQRQ